MLTKIIIQIAIISISVFVNSALGAYLPPAKGYHGMVSSEHQLASQIGLSILKQGGNAIDAAVAIGYALAVVDPCCGNLGGGGFMLIHRADGKDIFLDFRETAPAAISAQLFLDSKGEVNPQLTRRSYLAVGIPGTVMGLNNALKKYGSMSLTQVIQPAIQLAEQGYALSTDDIELFNKHLDQWKKTPDIASIFLKNGQSYQPGDLLIQKKLANTLKLISQYGNQAFYQGVIAQQIVAASKAHGGVILLNDFQHYQIKERQAIYCNYRNYQIVTTPPPGSGITICEILNILNGYSLTDLGYNSAANIHYNAEAMRYSFADRNQFLADPQFMHSASERLLSTQHIQQIRQDIEKNKLSNLDKKSFLNHEKSATTHYSVMDQFGNAVAVTTTLNGFFGSDLMAGDTGFFLNNELDDFTIKPGTHNMFKLQQGVENLIAPNKRPLSSMSPTIVLKDQKIFLALGAAGGSTIINSIVEAIEHVIDFKMDINTAINMPRYHMQDMPNKIFMEPYVFSPDSVQKLTKMGYHLQSGAPWGATFWGQMSGILYDASTGAIYGATDNRRPNGLAIGY